MLIDEMIAELQLIKEKIGNIPIYAYTCDALYRWGLYDVRLKAVEGLDGAFDAPTAVHIYNENQQYFIKQGYPAKK